MMRLPALLECREHIPGASPRLIMEEEVTMLMTRSVPAFARSRTRMMRLAPAIATMALLSPTYAVGQGAPSDAKVRRGEYIVMTSGCHDCHTPMVMGAAGPEPDMKRGLAGHPQDIQIRAPIALPAPWGAAFSASGTAMSGPWGVSFAANLTPDPETGVLRDFTEEQFIQTLRTGRHQGQGRQILPPMPWPVYGKMTDDDLKSVFAYLKQIPPVRNKVPDPVPPTQ